MFSCCKPKKLLNKQPSYRWLAYVPALYFLMLSKTLMKVQSTKYYSLELSHRYKTHHSPYWPYSLIAYTSTHLPWTKWPPFRRGISKYIFSNENVWISLKISLKFVSNVRNYNIPALIQIMAWRLPGDKPLSEPMMVSLLTHICVTRRQWVSNVK